MVEDNVKERTKLGDSPMRVTEHDLSPTALTSLHATGITHTDPAEREGVTP